MVSETFLDVPGDNISVLELLSNRGSIIFPTFLETHPLSGAPRAAQSALRLRNWPADYVGGNSGNGNWGKMLGDCA